ncbi:MAG: fibronectin type III domain-containing protein [Cyclobacteriaceae bacterium]|jgi:hypothetical protein
MTMHPTNTSSFIRYCITSLIIQIISTTTVIAQTPVLGDAGAIWHGSFGTYFASPNAIQIRDNYAYVATGSSLQIIDISNPSSPAIVSSIANGVTNVIFDNARSIAISGGYAFITSFSDSKLVIVNISDPLKPVVAARISNGYQGAVISFPQFIHVSGHYAYISNLGNNTVEILNISSPSNPSHVGTASDGVAGISLKSPRSIILKDNNAYVACAESNSIEVLDISNPTSPKHIGRLTNGEGGAILKQVESIASQGNYVYAVGIGSNSLEVIDITKPSAPKHVGIIMDGKDGALLNFPQSVTVSGEFAYVVSAISNALEIVNISDPTNPVHAGSLENGEGNAILDGPVKVLVSGTAAYILSSSSLEIADVSDPTAPFHKATIKNGDGSVKLEGARSVYVQGDHAYVACSVSNSLTVIDVSTPSKPRPAGVLLNGQNGANLLGASGVYISADLAFVASRWGHALEIINVSDPTNPIHVSTLSDGDDGAALSDPYAVYVSGGYAYVCNNYGFNLTIVDVRNPLTPIHVASINTGIFPTAVVVKENYAYVSTAYALQIIDISDPSSPFIAASLEDGTDGVVIKSGSSLYLSDGYVYVTSAASNSVEIIDVSNPLAPKHAGKTNFPDYILNNPQGISVEGNFAYVTCRGSFTVLNISKKNDPTFVTRFLNEDSEVRIGPTSPFIKNNYCYIAEPSENLLQVIELNGSNPPSSLQTVDSTSTSFRVRWKKELGAISYFVDLFKDYNPVGGFTNLAVNDTSFFFTGLEPLTHYYYRVRSYNGKSISLNSGKVHAFTFIVPVALPASNITTSSFRASWNPITASNWPNSYSFDIALDEAFSNPFNIIIPATAIAVNFIDLANDLTYYYRIRAGGYYDNGNIVYSPPSNVIMVKLSPIPEDPITEVSDPDNACSIEVFPVPAKTEINLLFKGFDNCCKVSFAIFNLMGQVVYQNQTSTFQTVSISLSTLPAGFYSIKVIQGDKTLTRSFIKE